MTDESSLSTPPQAREDDVTRTAELCASMHRELRDKYWQPYGRLVVENRESVLNEAQKVDRFVREVRATEGSLTDGQSEDQHPKLRQALPSYIAVGAWSTELQKYADNIASLEKLGTDLLHDPIFSKFADSALKHGDVYVSGGTMAWAMRGQYKDGFTYVSDVDVITDCSLDKFPDLVEGVRQDFQDDDRFEVVFSDERMPKLGIYDRETGKQFINLVPAEYFSARAQEVAEVLGDKLETKSDIETMLVKWNPYPYSQIAVHIQADKSTEVVNGGRPIMARNLFAENELSYTNWRTMRELGKVNANQEADKLLRRAINHIARFPKDIVKGVPLPEAELHNSEKKPETFEVALAEFITNDDNVYKNKVRHRAADNLVTAIRTGTSRIWDLPRLGFDGLFSETLIKKRGYVLEDNGDKVGDKYVGLPENDIDYLRVSSAIATLPVKVLDDPTIYDREDVCQTATEYFAVIAGLSLLDDDAIDTVAEEIDDSWPKHEDPQKSFRKEIFIRWTKSIRNAVEDSKTSYEFLPYWKNKANSHDDGLEWPSSETDTYIYDMKAISDSIHQSDFWKERNELSN